MKKKILVDAYYAKNVGDDLFLKILFDRYRDVDFYMSGAKAEYKEIFEDYNNVFLHSNYTNIFSRIFNKITRYRYAYNNYDALVYIGGSIFMQHKGAEGLHKVRLRTFKSFKNKNKKVFVIGSNFGPYLNEAFKNSYEKLFKGYEDICFREQLSYDMFSHLANVRVAPDVVFQLKHDEKEYKRKKSLGISLIDLESRSELNKYENEYLTKIQEIIKKYIDLDYKVTLFSFCEKEQDGRTIKKILDNIENKYKENIDVFNYNGNIDEFLDRYRSMESIIATRFHAMILALVFGQNVFPIIYSEKTYNVLKDLGLEKNSVRISDISNLEVDKIIQLSRKNILKDRKILRDAEKQFLKLDEFIKDLN